MRVRGLVGALGIALCATVSLVAPVSIAAGAPLTPSGPLATAARVGSTPASQPLQLVLPLQTDSAGLRRHALAVSTPGSPEFGQYESIASLSRQFGAPAVERRRVLDYLHRVGATAVKVDATGLFVDATLTAGTAQRLFATSLAQYRTAHGASFTAPSDAPAVPAPLRGLVTGVVGLDTRPVLTPPRRFHSSRAVAHAASQSASGYFPVTGTPSGCGGAVATGSFTPNQYLTAYQYNPLHAGGINGHGERVALIEIDGFKHSDISTFAKCFGLRVPPITSFGVGLKKSLKPGGESTLDLEVLAAAAPGLKGIDVYESNSNEAAALQALTSPLQNGGFKPQVISASLGLCEQFVYGAVHKSGVEAAEGALEEAAASGISFLDSSGDSGSADCLQSDGTPIDTVAVNYPASSWWVTGVGGTNLVLNSDNTIAGPLGQLVWNDTNVQPGSAGGGGPSGLFYRPPYQKGTVAPNEREVPDVSMLADVAPGYAIYCSATSDCINSQNHNPWQGVGGTSAATPLLAGGFALVDQELRMHQRQDLGLANPLLYRIGRAPAMRAGVFSDVLSIGNDVGPFISGSGRGLGCCTAGVGYDDASGWGSVNLASFATVALAAQPKIVGVGLSLPGSQRPVAARHINATVSCTGKCVLGAFAVVQIGHAKPFKVLSNLYVLRSRGKKTAKINFSRGQLGKLRAGLKAHKRIVAGVVGAIVDAGGNIERRSSTKLVRIKA
jgi:kumamolisin